NIVKNIKKQAFSGKTVKAKPWQSNNGSVRGNPKIMISTRNSYGKSNRNTPGKKIRGNLWVEKKP
ncbi:MAG TPA: hypothetical protein VFF13_06795, partial [archaeon]|nr:hypothetical protein [archaeon]